jgi:hypothetical protein
LKPNFSWVVVEARTRDIRIRTAQVWVRRNDECRATEDWFVIFIKPVKDAPIFPLPMRSGRLLNSFVLAGSTPEEPNNRSLCSSGLL